MKEITPIVLKEIIEKGEKLRIIDVRETEEFAICRIKGAELIPLSQFSQRAPQEINSQEKVIMYCHHGMRSARAQEFLEKLGYSSVLNLVGGIDAWAREVEPTMHRY